MARTVELAPSAQRSLRKLPIGEVERLYPRMLALGDEPLPRGAVKLRGAEDSYRIRVGDYRIVYRVLAETVRITTIGHRRDVYR